MIGLPEILVVIVLLLVFGAPVMAGIVIWKYVMKPRKATPEQHEQAK
jgi:hypothetical protein